MEMKMKTFQQRLEEALQEGEKAFLADLKIELSKTEAQSEIIALCRLTANAFKQNCDCSLIATLTETKPEQKPKDSRKTPLKQNGVNYLEDLIDWLSASICFNPRINHHVEILAKAIEAALQQNEERAVKQQARRLIDVTEFINYRDISTDKTVIKKEDFVFYLNYFYDGAEDAATSINVEDKYFAHFIDDFPPFPRIIAKREKVPVKEEDLKSYSLQKKRYHEANESIGLDLANHQDATDLANWAFLIVSLTEICVFRNYCNPVEMIARYAAFEYYCERRDWLECTLKEIAHDYGEPKDFFNAFNRLTMLENDIVNAAKMT